MPPFFFSLQNLLGPAQLKREYDVTLGGGLDWMLERVLLLSFVSFPFVFF